MALRKKVPFLSLNSNSHYQVKKSVIVTIVQWNKIWINSEKILFYTLFTDEIYVLWQAFKYIKSHFNSHKPGSFYLSKDSHAYRHSSVSNNQLSTPPSHASFLTCWGRGLFWNTYTLPFAKNFKLFYFSKFSNTLWILTTYTINIPLRNLPAIFFFQDAGFVPVFFSSKW